MSNGVEIKNWMNRQFTVLENVLQNLEKIEPHLNDQEISLDLDTLMVRTVQLFLDGLEGERSFVEMMETICEMSKANGAFPQEFMLLGIWDNLTDYVEWHPTLKHDYISRYHHWNNITKTMLENVIWTYKTYIKLLIIEYL